MNERDINIIDAAFRMFTRYGVKRTSMNDIACEAGISRQTLYNAFANKDEVLKATIRLFTDRAISDIEREREENQSLGEHLDSIFNQLVVRPYKKLHDAPNTQDLIEGFNAAGQKEMCESYEKFRSLIIELLAPFEIRIVASGMTLDAFAEFIRSSATSAKYAATSEAHLKELLHVLKTMTLFTVGEQ